MKGQYGRTFSIGYADNCFLNKRGYILHSKQSILMHYIRYAKKHPKQRERMLRDIKFLREYLFETQLYVYDYPQTAGHASTPDCWIWSSRVISW